MFYILSLSTIPSPPSPPPFLQPCPADGPSYRAVQCSAFDATPYKGDNHTWLPVQMKSTKLWQIRLTENLLTTFALFILCIQGAPCQLHSKPEGQFFSVMLSDSVVDETPCNPTTRDMCINGVCRVTMKWQALLLVLTRWNRLHRNGRHPQSHPRIIIIIFTNLLNIVLY